MSKEKQELEVITEDVAVIVQNAIVDTSSIDRVFEAIKSDIEALELDTIEPTDENKKRLVELRIGLNNKFKEVNGTRLAIGRVLDEPKKDLNDKVKPLTDYINENLDIVKEAIDVIENRQREIKFEELQQYFLELKATYVDKLEGKTVDIIFIGFEDMELNITLSASMASLKKQIDERLEQHYNNLLVIEGNENMARVYALYQVNKDLNQSLLTVQEAIKREEKIIANAKPVEEVKVEEEVVEDGGATEEPKVNVVEEIIKVKFELEDTRANIIKVREFMKLNNINYKGI